MTLKTKILNWLAWPQHLGDFPFSTTLWVWRLNFQFSCWKHGFQPNGSVCGQCYPEKRFKLAWPAYCDRDGYGGPFIFNRNPTSAFTKKIREHNRREARGLAAVGDRSEYLAGKRSYWA